MNSMLNKIILGAAQLGMNYGINNYGPLNKNEVFEILDFAIENGIKTIDTAEVYGNSINLIGNYIKERSESNLKLISKIDVNLDLKRLNFERHIQNQLNTLGINSFYGYMFHDYKSFKNNDFAQKKLNDLVDYGMIKNVGISVYETNNIIDIVKNYKFDFIQLPFNLLDNEEDKIEILKIAYEKQIKIHVRSVFLQGLFFKPLKNYSKKIEPLKKYIKKLNNISLDSKMDIESLALMYPLKKYYIDKVIFGVHNLEQFSKNIKIINSNISIPEKKIEEILVKEKELLKPYNWK